MHIEPWSCKDCNSIENRVNKVLGVEGAGDYFMEIVCKSCGRKDIFFNKEANKKTELLKVN